MEDFAIFTFMVLASMTFGWLFSRHSVSQVEIYRDIEIPFHKNERRILEERLKESEESRDTWCQLASDSQSLLSEFAIENDRLRSRIRKLKRRAVSGNSAIPD